MKLLSVPIQTKATGLQFTVALLIDCAADDGSSCLVRCRHCMITYG